MFPLFNTDGSMLAVILLMIAFAFWSQKFKAFQMVGPAMTVIILGIILANLRIVPGYVPAYGAIATYAVPMSISIYLLGINLKDLGKLSKEPWIAIGCAVVTVGVVATIFGVVFGGQLFEGWKVSGMFVGTYTGGSANLTAIAIGLEAAEETIAAANTADYIIGMPTLILMFAAPAIYKGSKWLRKVWPYHFTEEEYKQADKNGGGFLQDETWSIKDIAWLMAIGMSVVSISTTLAGFFPSSFASAARILLISTISLIAGQLPPVKKLRGTINLGMFFGMMYLCIIGFMVDLREFATSAITMTIFCLCVIVFSILLHMLLLRLFKVKYEYMVLSITAAIADGGTSALVATGGGWTNLVGVALLMGLIGSVGGNYLGIGVAYLVKMIIGA